MLPRWGRQRQKCPLPLPKRPMMVSSQDRHHYHDHNHHNHHHGWRAMLNIKYWISSSLAHLGIICCSDYMIMTISFIALRIGQNQILMPDVFRVGIFLLLYNVISSTFVRDFTCYRWQLSLCVHVHLADLYPDPLGFLDEVVPVSAISQYSLSLCFSYRYWIIEFKN